MRRLQSTRGLDERGFSLVELLVVIIIIGILSAIAVPLLMKQRRQAIDATLRSDLRTVATAMEAARTADGDLPASASGVASEVRLSPGNSVQTVVDGADYCLRATNARASGAWTFDTAGDGLARTAGGTCAGAVDFTLP